jgi:rare lipoprotein A
MPSPKTRTSRLKYIGAIAIAWSLAAGASVGSMLLAPNTSDASSAPPPRPSTAQLDRSGRKQVGKASYYASRYAGKTMADGTPMHLYSSNAASVTLPLGTVARVTNLNTGRSAVVTIQDRGPYVRGRIIDLSPATAHRIGLDRKQGIAPVEVAPLTVPLADGTVKVVSNQRIVAAADM